MRLGSRGGLRIRHAENPGTRWGWGGTEMGLEPHLHHLPPMTSASHHKSVNFITSKGNLYPISNHFPVPPASGNHRLLSASMDLPILDISYKGNYSWTFNINGPLYKRELSVASCGCGFIMLSMYIDVATHFFLWLNNIP